VAIRNNPLAKHKPRPSATWPTKPGGTPDFASMTPAQRLSYHTARLKR
jgi:hypothetical protein